MMHKIIRNYTDHDLKDAKFLKSDDFVCTSCAMGKLILWPSPLKIHAEPLRFLERIQEDIYGPIQPLCDPFRYFMVLIDASTRWSHVCLLSTRNHAFAKFMTQVIRLKANYPKYRIISIRMDNTAEFSSQAFNDYCMAQGIEVQHSVPYVHTQNGLTESLIKIIKLIARPLLQGCNLPTSCWGHAVLHATDLVQLRPIVDHTTSPLQLICGDQSSISHMQKFGSALYMSIYPPKQTSMGPHMRMGIYVGYQSPSILKYLEPLTGDFFTIWFADCIFNKVHFLTLEGDNKFITDGRDINWDDKSILSSDPRTKETELQVQKIIELQQIASNLPDAFTDYKGVTKSLNPAVNAPYQVKLPIKTTPPLKRGRASQ
jgi:hypothetical protein